MDRTCALCGNKELIEVYDIGEGPFEVRPIDGRFEVHHLDGNRSNNEPTNLATLCRPCHVQLHRGAQNSGWMSLAEYERRRAAKPSRRSAQLPLRA